MNKERSHYIDVTRAGAGLMIVLSHVCSPLKYVAGEIGLLTWGFFNMIDLVTGVGVPFFLMISGKLLLGSSRPESAVDFLKRRTSRVFVPFVAWSVVYAFVFAHTGKGWPVLFALKNMYWHQTSTHLWFMYVLLGIYLLTPPIRVFVRSATQRDLVYVLALWSGFLVMAFFVNGSESRNLSTKLLGYGGYFVLGLFLDRMVVSRRTAAVLVMTASGALFLSALLGSGEMLRDPRHGARFYSHTSPLLALAAGSLFLAIKALPFNNLFRWRPNIGRAIRWLGAESYNVYLMHVLFIVALANGWLGIVLTARSGPSSFVGVPLTFAAVMLLSWTFLNVIRALPMLGRFLTVSTKNSP